MITEKERKALAIAVKAICFDDSSDYEAYLWEIVDELGGKEATNLLEYKPDEAYSKYCQTKEDQ